MSRKIHHINELKAEGNEFKLTPTTHIDEIGIQPRHFLTNKSSAFVPSENDPSKLEKSMFVFLLSTLTEEKTSISLCSKLVFDVKSEHLQETLLAFLEKLSKIGTPKIGYWSNNSPTGT